MRRFFARLLSGLVPAGQVAATDDVPAAVARALEGWRPIAVERIGSSLVVTAKERRVSSQVYEAMMLAGLCAFVAAGKVSLPGINRIVILNRFKASGWVFEGGAALCRDVVAAPRRARRIRLLEHTHLY